MQNEDRNPEAPDTRGRVPVFAASEWQILVLILILASLLRLNNLGQPFVDVFSWRQASTAMMAENYYRTSWNIFFPEVNWSGPGPGYQGREFQTVTYLSAILYLMFGQQDWVGRGVCVAFGVWGVFAFYCLVRRVWDAKHALAGALMLALMPGAIFIDRSFLPDPGMVALVTTTLWLMVGYLQSGRRSLLPWLVATTALGFATKPTGLVTLIPLGFALYAIRPRGAAWSWSSRTSVGMGIVAASVIATSAYLYWAVYLGTHYPPYHVAGSANWLWKDGLSDWIGRKYFLDHLFRNARYWLWTPPLLFALVIGVAPPPPMQVEETSSGGSTNGIRWLFHFWLAACVLLYALGARELKENAWNLHSFSPTAAAFAGVGLLRLSGFVRRVAGPGLALAAASALVFHLGISGQGVLQTMYKPQNAWQSYEMGLALRELTSPGDLVLTIANDVGDPIPIYYSRRRGWVFPPPGFEENKSWNLMPEDDKTTIRIFEEMRKRGAGWMGIVDRPQDDRDGKGSFWANHAEFVAHLNLTCELIQKTNEYVIYRIPAPVILDSGGGAETKS